MATTPNPKPAPRTKKSLPKPSPNLKKGDYLYSLEVASQPAKSKADKEMKRKAKANVKYLEAKFPKYTSKMKSTEGRITPPSPKYKIIDNTPVRRVSGPKSRTKAQ